MTLFTGLGAAEIPVASGGDIVSAIDGASSGDAIVIESGGTYTTGHITLNKTIALKVEEGAAVQPKITSGNWRFGGTKGIDITIEFAVEDGTTDVTDHAATSGRDVYFDNLSNTLVVEAAHVALVELFDMNGRLLLVHEMNQDEAIDLAGSPVRMHAVYLVRLTINDGTVQTFKLKK